jgi:hypothetical protein
MQAKLLLAAVLCLPISLCAGSCIQSPEDLQLTSADNDPEPIEQAEITSAANDPEPIGEAEQEWTKADCYTAWKYNMVLCNSSPPNLRPQCWAAASALLGACLATAQ